MTPAGRAIGRQLERAVRRVRVEAGVSIGLAVAAVALAVLLVAWVVGDAWPVRGVGPLALQAAGALAGATVGVALARRWLVDVDPVRVAAEAERRRGLPEGSLRGAVELGRGLPAGTSAALFRRSESELARGLAGVRPRELAGELGDGVGRLRARVLRGAAALAGLTLVAGFAAPERARAGWAPLLHPLAHLDGPVLPPLQLRPGDAEVARGDRVRLEVEAPGRARATLHWQAVGDVPRDRSVPLEGGGGTAELGPVEAPLRYWASTPDGAATDTFTLRPVDPLLVSGLTLDVTYPPHVGRPAETFVGDVPPLLVPEGTRLRIAGTATGPLRSAALVRPDGEERRLRVSGAGFDTDWRLGPASSGRWSWRLQGAAGRAAAEMRALELTVTEDQAPRVRITAPEPEAALPGGRRQAVAADAEDDHGVAAAALVFRRVSGASPGPEQRAAIPLETTRTPLLLRAVLDASALPLAPGDRVEYHVEVTDNGPGAQVGRSATHVLRVPGGRELRERARSQADAARQAAERLAERSRQLERETRSLSRRSAGQGRSGSPGASSAPGDSPERVGFDTAREAEEVVAEQEAQLAEAEALRERLAALERAVEEAGLEDAELQRRMAELRELYRRLASPELREQLDALRNALAELDPESLNRALAELAERQEDLRESVEQSLELMRRAAAEQELTALAREAEEIAAQQRALAEAMRDEAHPAPPAEQSAAGEPKGEPKEKPESPESPESPNKPADMGAAGQTGATPEAGPEGPERRRGPKRAASDSARSGEDPGESAAGENPLALPTPRIPTPRIRAGERAEQQDSLGDRTRRLNESLKALQQQLVQLGERESASQTGAAQEEGESARASMGEASSQARRQQGSQAAESGQRAAGQMADAAARLDQARREMADSWREEAQQAVQQATQEALDLAQREEALRQAMEQAQQQGGARGEALQGMRSEQAALQQGLQQLGRNLSETGRRSGMVDPEVGRSLAQAMLNMQQTLEGMQEGGASMPVQQAQQSVESLNRLAMSLLQNDAQLREGQGASAMQQALQRLSELARQQASVNGQTGAVAPLQLSEGARARQLQQLARQQRGIGRRVGEVSEVLGGREDALGRLDLLSAEAEQLARELAGGRLDPEVRARQERLFRRLLDAGRSLEREEYSDERLGERAGAVDAASPAAIDPALLDHRLRYTPPSSEELRVLPPAYRRLILDYFDRLNSRPGSEAESDPGAGAGEGGRR